MKKNKRENMFLTDKIARKAFCVGGLYYHIRITILFQLAISPSKSNFSNTHKLFRFSEHFWADQNYRKIPIQENVLSNV